MVTTHNIQKVSFDKDFMYLKIDDKELKFELDKISTKLKSANEIQRNLYKVSPSGYGIHWPLIDEDLSVDALLKAA